MTVLVTGATGFIGTRVIARLTATGHDITALVRPQTLACSGRARGFDQNGCVGTVKGDLEDTVALAAAMRGVDVVYHLAAELPRPGVGRRDLVRVNVRGTKNVLEAASTTGVRRIVFLSSASVYERDEMGVGEDAPLRPQGVYGTTKLDGERVVREYARRHAFEHVVLRPNLVYGSGAPFFERLVQRMLHAPGAVFVWGPAMLVQWVHVDDVADAVTLAGVHRNAAGQCFNVAGPDAATLRELVRIVQRVALGCPIRNVVAPTLHPSPAWPRRYDIRKAARLLGFIPHITLEQGIGGMAEAALTAPEHQVAASPTWPRMCPFNGQLDRPIP